VSPTSPPGSRGVGGEVVAVAETQHSAVGAKTPTVSDTDAEDSRKGSQSS
jgi:hypothetical protein